MTLGWLPGLLATLSCIGIAQALAGWVVTARFARTTTPAPAVWEPVTVLKPLHGNETLLTEALTTLFEQDYPAPWQIVFGVQDSADAAIDVVRALRSRYPARDVALVVDPAAHGANPKVGNLINMFPAAKHAVLIIADSDVHARPDYLRHVVAALSRPRAGLVTTLYTGLPGHRGIAAWLGATQVTHGFLPGALLARALGSRDCLGATMGLRRDTLAAIGGLEGLKDHLADDNVLGRKVRAHGLDVVLAGTIVATTIPEPALAPLWRHELRWARTIRALEPAGFAGSVLQYPIFWALLTVCASGFAYWAWALVLLVWAIRALAATGIDRSLAPMLAGLAFPCPVWLLPARDLLCAAEWVVSHAGRRVDWRGQSLEADTPPRFSQGPNAR